MFSAFTNSFKVPELRQKILFTLGLIFVARVGAHIPLPGLNPEPLNNFFKAQSATAGSLVGLYNMFTGGAFLKGAIFGLGIMPYISASIIIQLMSAVVPSIARLQQEGELGRQKIVQYTRYLTIIICIAQAVLLVLAITNYPSKLFPGFDPITFGPIVMISSKWFLFTSTVFLTAGTVILMWLGEQITQRGVGNGISILITIGILGGLPSAISQLISMFSAPIGSGVAPMGVPHAILMAVLFFAVVAVMVAMTQAQRKIPVQYAKRMVGRKVMAGQGSYLPLKVNYSGVMPVIFSSAILMFPQQIFAYLSGATNVRFFQTLAQTITQGSALYYILFGSLILAFSYFWVSIMFKPIQIADDLKKNGGYIPAVRPGPPTAQFLDFVMTRLTLAGSLFLTSVALFPDILFYIYRIPISVALFFGGTGTLITVGVVLDTMRQIETALLQRHYDGFLKKNKSRSKNQYRNLQLIDTKELKSLTALWWPLGILFFIGIIAWILQKI